MKGTYLIGAVLERPGIDLVDYSRLPPVAVLKQTSLTVKNKRFFVSMLMKKSN
jgi:hypothetical protein